MLLTHDEGGVRLLTLDRPDKLNAMTSALYRACAASLAEAAGSDEIGAVVLTGSGRAFCAGNDLGELMGAAELALAGSAESGPAGRSPADGGSITGDAGADQGGAFAAFMDAISGFPKVLLAAVNGVGVGIGMTLLPFCDGAYIAASARLKGPFVPLGVAPEAASSATFAATMGWQRAARILLSGAWVSAAEAVEVGLALEVVPDDEVVGRTVALAREMVTAGPLASIVATKQLLVAARRELVSNARSREDATFKALFEAGVPGTGSPFA